jgi:bacteriocin biosynthesis cyclodehydratase domain-containing protein
VTERPGAPHTRGAPRLRLRATIEPFFASDGNVYLLRGGAGKEHLVRRPDDFDRDLLRRLADGGVQIVPGSREHARVAPLVEAGAVVPEPRLCDLGAIDAQRFARQLPYLEDFGDPVAAQRRLRASSVTVMGCGGLGTWALGALASVGIGRVVLVDDDVVELSNLNRQILYRPDDAGRPKVELAAAWLAAFDPAIEVVARRERVRDPASVRALLAGCDVLLVTADWPPYDLNRWVNAECLACGVPFISAGQQPPLIRVGPTCVPGRGACFVCHEQRLRRQMPFYDELERQRRERAAEAGTLGPISGLIGTLLACEVMHLLLGHWPLATHERVLLFDSRTLHSSWDSFSRDPACRHCSEHERQTGADATW